MAPRLSLEDFGAVPQRPTAAPGGQSAAALTEEQRLAAYEAGYRAGWEDSAKALETEHRKLAADLAGNLRDLSFGYHEAHSAVLKGVEPVLRAAVDKLLPDLARATLPDLVHERLQPLLSEAATVPVLLQVAPATREAVAAILPADPGMPLEVREDPALGEGQVILRAGDREVTIDVDAALADITRAVEEFFTLQEQESAVANG